MINPKVRKRDFCMLLIPGPWFAAGLLRLVEKRVICQPALGESPMQQHAEHK